jgi:hypothetical protein
MEITKLVKDVDILADLWKKTILSEIEFIKLLFTCEYSRYITGELIYVSKMQFDSDEDAFVALIKKIVFDSEIWNDSNADLTVEEWKNSLEKFIIPNYIRIKDFRQISDNEFWDRFIFDMKGFGKSKDFIDCFKDINKDLKVYVLEEYSPSVQIFGISEKVYFIYDFFAGD